MAEEEGKGPDHTQYRTADGIGATELVFIRNEFYREKYRQLIKLCFLLIFIIILQTIFTLYLKNTHPKPVYFPTSPDGRLLTLKPLDQPNLTLDELSRWVMEASIASYTFNFTDWRFSLQDARRYYTANGYQNFLKALKESRNLEAVKTKKFIVSAIPLNLPVIKEVPTETLFRWKVEIPMLLTYQNGNPADTIKQEITMTMLIVRISNLDSLKGVGIEQVIIAEGRKAPPTSSAN
ncbi:MAG: DotI/IcmL/TraM family protein [Gammaproteobacteria bacterium]